MVRTIATCLTLWSAVLCSMCNAADDGAPCEQAQIKKAITSYVAAFNNRDAKTLAAHWSPEGVYISRLSGDQVTGREALEKEFNAIFESAKDVRLEAETLSVEFVSPNVAVEQGKATVIRPNEAPVRSDYSVVYIKREGKWLVDRVTEEQRGEPPSHYEQLKDLEWMIGDWVDQSGDVVIKTQCQWVGNRNFVLRAFTASVADRKEISGMQFIGWDAAKKQIRSWVFDSDGGLNQEVWEKKADRWIVKLSATLPDGKNASSTSIFRPIDQDRFSWQQVNRIVAGEIQPNIDEVVIVREGSVAQ